MDLGPPGPTQLPHVLSGSERVPQTSLRDTCQPLIDITATALNGGLRQALHGAHHVRLLNPHRCPPGEEQLRVMLQIRNLRS